MSDIIKEYGGKRTYKLPRDTSRNEMIAKYEEDKTAKETVLAGQSQLIGELREQIGDLKIERAAKMHEVLKLEQGALKLKNRIRQLERARDVDGLIEEAGTEGE